MDPQAALDDLMRELEADGVRIVRKEGWLWELLHFAVMVVTFGSNRKFLTDYYTTIGHWIGVPEGWEHRPASERFAVLQHEWVHVQQCRWFGFGNATVGLPLFGLFYLLLPLPIGLAYFRYRFERVAYAEGINAAILFAPGDRDWLIGNAVKQLTTGRYAWTWPFPWAVRRYFEAHVDLPPGLRAVN